MRTSEYCIWDIDLPGFGLRGRPTGRYFWFVRVRYRNKHRRVSLGRTDEVDAELARTQHGDCWETAALDGMPKRTVIKVTPTLNDYVETYWSDTARCWKPSTAKFSLHHWRYNLAPVFGSSRVADITKEDVTRWRLAWWRAFRFPGAGVRHQRDN